MQAVATKKAKCHNLDQRIVSIVSSKPQWMPEIAKTSGVSLVKTRNAVARMFDLGVIEMTRQGFTAAR